MQHQPVESLLRSLRWLQTSREYSDLKIVCGRKIFQVHRAVVCPRSKYFATSCRWTQDGRVKDEIRLDDDDPTIVGLMIDYLYQMDYDDLLPSKEHTSPVERSAPEPTLPGWISPMTEPVSDPKLLQSAVSYHGNFGPPEPGAPELEDDYISEPEPEPTLDPDTFDLSKPLDFEWRGRERRERNKRPTPPHLEPDGKDLHTARLTVNALVYAIADRYEIDNLKDIAKAKFEIAVLQDWKSPAFAFAAELVASTTPNSDRGLRSIVIDTINKHRELVNYEEIQNLLDSGNGMAWGLIQVLLNGQNQALKANQAQMPKNRRLFQ